MKKIDITALAAFVLALVILSFFWGCEYDPVVTALGVIIILVSAITAYLQNKKIKELENTKDIR